MNQIIKTLFFIIVLAVLSSGLVFADTVCLDDPLSCNDILLIYTATENPTILDLIGYEYGCNENERLIKGVARIVGNIVYANYRIADEEFFGGIFDSPPGFFAKDIVFILEYNLSTNSVTYKFHASNAFPSTEAAGTYVPEICPAVTAITVTPDGPDRIAELGSDFSIF